MSKIKMIFLSHNSNDKPVVEPVALALREIFGQDKVFYDSWSIQPGEGIIQRMNEGLESPDFVFFFVSENSLKSEMVKLEWQNSLMRATKGECRLVPVRVSDVQMPALLLQNVYIDMFSRGLEVSVHQIVNLVQGNSTFTPEHVGFSNLTWSFNGDPFAEIEICIKASHLMEPNPYFLIVTTNTDDEISIDLKDKFPNNQRFGRDIIVHNGKSFNGFEIVSYCGAITPKLPMRILIKVRKKGEKIDINGVMHVSSEENYTNLPLKP